MNWITNYVRPRINSLFSRREVPENLWTKCPECGTMLFHRELSDNLNVCTNCDHHLAISPRDRFTALFDGGAFLEVKVPEPIADPLQFRDQKKYPDRMKAAQKATGEKEAMLVAEGEMGRTPIVAAASSSVPSRPRKITSTAATAIWSRLAATSGVASRVSATSSSRHPAGRGSASGAGVIGAACTADALGGSPPLDHRSVLLPPYTAR